MNRPAFAPVSALAFWLALLLSPPGAVAAADKGAGLDPRMQGDWSIDPACTPSDGGLVVDGQRFSGWEFTCAFTRIVPDGDGATFSADCAAEGEESTLLGTIRLVDPNTLEIASDGSPTTYHRCKASALP